MKTPYELWKESQGKVSSGAPIRSTQYTLPNYQGNSGSRKTYKWETDNLKPIKSKKNARSYNDKFDNWAKDNKISDATEFRTWLDSKEDKVKTTSDWMNETLSGLKQKNQADAEKMKLVSPKKDVPKKINEVSKPKKKHDPTFLDDIKATGKAAGQFFNPFDKVSASDAVKNYLNHKQSDTFKDVARGSNRTVDSVSLGAMSNLDKKVNNRTPYYTSEREFGKGGGTDLVTSGLGYLVPGVGAYKGVNALKAGKALTKFGEKSIGKRLVSEGVKGATIGAGLSGAEVGVKETLNPKDQNWKDNLKYVGMNTAIGAIADPALYGAGKVIGKGFEKASEKTMKNLLLSNKQFADTVSSTVSKADKIKPTEYTLPNGQKVHIKNRVTDQLEHTQAKIEETKPKAEQSQKEFEDAVQQQYNYLKSSMGKGTQSGGLVRDAEGYVTNAYGRVSNNPKWYQDFYKQQGRKPNNTELRQLAEDHVKNGFQDETGSLPAWQPKKVQEIDDQISEYTNLLQDNPHQEEAIRPILNALEEDRTIALKEFEQPSNDLPGLQKDKANLERTLKGEPIHPMKVPNDIQAMQGETIPLRESSGTKQFKEMGLFESAVNKVTKKYEQPITHQELLHSMKKNLGVTLRTGRMGKVSEEVKGFFKVDPEVIRSKRYGDVPVISHEIGHHLDKQFNLSNEAFDSELMKLGEVTSGKDYTPEQVRSEGLAEYIRLFLTDPEKAIAEAPNFSQHFKTVLPSKVKKGLLKTQADVDRWIEQGPELQLRGKIDRTGKEHSTTGEKVDKIYSQFVDKFDRLKKVEKAITGKIGDGAQSIYKKARLAAGAPKKAEIILKDFKRILKPIEKYGYNMKDVSDYVTAIHARELETMGEKVAKEAMVDGTDLSNTYKELGNTEEFHKLIGEFESKYEIQLTEEQLNSIEVGNDLELTDDQLYLINQANRIESGMTKEQIDKSIIKYDTPEMNQVQQEIVDYNSKLLDRLVEGQVISKEAVAAMKEKYPNYVPFYRFFEDDMTVGLGGNKGFTNLTSPVKRLKGSTLNVIDPLESMIKNTFAVVNAVEKNKVGLELSRLVDVEGAGKYIERLDGAEKVPREHIVTVFENGEKVQYQLDKDLYDSIQQLDEDIANKVIQFLSYPTSMLRAGATLTPEFMLRNPIRDQFQAFVVSNYGYNPIIDLPLGIWHVIAGKTFKKDGIYKQWAMNGGGYGNYLSQDRNYLRETLNTLKKEGKWYQKGYKTITNPKELGKLTMQTLRALSEISEEATKVGEFRKALKKGATPEEAAFQSRDLMDFGRVGSDMKQWNRAVAFLNANIQGKDKIARAFKNNPIRTTTKAITGVTLPAFGAYMAMEHLANDKQRETYDNTPKWMKDTFFIFPIPGTDELARIPKPFDLAPVFANPVENIMNYMKDNDPEAWDEFLKRQAVAILQIPHMLTGLAPMIENVTNYSFFTGGPIVPRRDQELLPQDQYGVSTSLTARTVGKMTGTSPYKTDNLIRGYGAGLGKYATAGMDSILEKAGAGKLPPQEAKKWSELPVVNAFTVDNTGGGQVMTDFYDTIDKLTKEHNSAKRNQDGYETGDDVNYSREEDYKALNKASREIGKLRNEYRKVQSDYNESPESKRSSLDELDRQMNQLAREVLVQIGEKK